MATRDARVHLLGLVSHDGSQRLTLGSRPGGLVGGSLTSSPSGSKVAGRVPKGLVPPGSATTHTRQVIYPLRGAKPATSIQGVKLDERFGCLLLPLGSRPWDGWLTRKLRPGGATFCSQVMAVGQSPKYTTALRGSRVRLG